MKFIILFFVAVLCIMQTSAFMVNPFKLKHSNLKFSATTGAGKEKANVIGKGDLLKKLQEATSFRKRDIEAVLQSFIDIIREDVLHQGSEVRIRDFGTFKPKFIAARDGRNPKTGEPIKIGASSTVKFSPSDSGFRTRHVD